MNHSGRRILLGLALGPRVLGTARAGAAPVPGFRLTCQLCDVSLFARLPLGGHALPSWTVSCFRRVGCGVPAHYIGRPFQLGP